MADPCLAVTKEKIRAEVLLGTQVIARTPFVKSFNVQKARTQISSTFSLVAEIPAAIQFQLGEKISIRAGLRGNLKTIFTGNIDNLSPSPALGKPSYYTIRMSGGGVLSELENKTFSRRLQSTGQGLFCLITGGPSNAADKYYVPDKPVKSGNHTFVNDSPNPVKGQNSGLVVHNSSPNQASTGGILGHVAERPGGGAEVGAGGGSFVDHEHKDIGDGGPAFGVYSAD